MPGWLINFARTGVQAGWGLLVAHFAVLQVIPQDVAVDWIMTTLVVGGSAALLHWMETRQGDTFWPRLARGIAHVAMLGLSSKQPVYVKPAAQ